METAAPKQLRQPLLHSSLLQAQTSRRGLTGHPALFLGKKGSAGSIKVRQGSGAESGSSERAEKLMQGGCGATTMPDIPLVGVFRMPEALHSSVLKGL